MGQYKTGTATIDLVAAGSNSMLWQGLLEGIISPRKTTFAADLDKGLRQLFERFPD